MRITLEGARLGDNTESGAWPSSHPRSNDNGGNKPRENEQSDQEGWRRS
jgi:hypothetical protein